MPESIVVVVGGGSFGTAAAKRLAKTTPSSTKIYLITPLEYVPFLPGSIRLLIHQKPEKVAFPIAEALKEEIKSGRVEFICDKVSNFSSSSVELTKTSKVINYTILVLATGCIWPSPVDFTQNQESSMGSILRFIKPQAEEFENAKSVAIIGGGDIGVELIGELATASPDKEYHLIHNKDKLLTERFVPHVRDNALNQIKALFPDVKVHFNSYGEKNNNGTVTVKNINTNSSKTISADLVFQTTGPKPNLPATSFDKAILLNSSGFVKIKGTFQTIVSDNIFAIGDITDMALKGIILRDKWLDVLVANIKFELGLTKKIVDYKLPSFENIPGAVSIGPNGGTGQAKVPLLGVCALPKWVVVKAKSAKLFAEQLEKHST